MYPDGGSAGCVCPAGKSKSSRSADCDSDVAGLRYAGSSWDGRNVLKTPDYTLFDAMLGYETGPWGASLAINNLADKVHVITCLNCGDCFYGARRNMTANLRYTF